VARPAEHRREAAARRRETRRAAAVVEVHVGHDHEVDVVRRQAHLAQRGLDRAVVVDAVDVLELGRELVAVAGLDQDALPASLDQQAARRVLAAVERIARHQLRPQRLRHHPVHGPTIEAEVAAVEHGHARVPDRQHP
jgi:hypothetical protein